MRAAAAIVVGLLVAIGSSVAGFPFETRGAHDWSGFFFVVWALGLFVAAGLAVFGLVASLGIERAPAADPQRRFRLRDAVDFAGPYRLIRRDRVLFLAVVGNTYFWFLGALLQLNIFFYGADVLKIREIEIGYLQAAVAVGIGAGSLAGEQERGTLAYLLSQPVNRAEVLIGKYLGLAASLSAASSRRRCASLPVSREVSRSF